MSTFADTVRATDEEFYAYFPAARKAPEPVFAYQYQYQYQYPAALHYDYYPASPTLSSSSTPVVGYDPALDTLPTPPLQHAYFVPDQLVATSAVPGSSSGVYQQPQHQPPQPQQHSLHVISTPRRPSYPYIQSPIEAYSPSGPFSLPPDTPSDLGAASPRSDGEDFPELIGHRPFRHYQARSSPPPPAELHHQPGSSRGVSPPAGRGPHQQELEYGPATHSRPQRALTNSHQYPPSHSHSQSLSQHPHSHSHEGLPRPARGLSWDPQSRVAVGEILEQPLPPQRLSPLPSKRILEKKPPLACLFCRGRKIACGPPLPGSSDKTCNQCQRRSLQCEYPSESRRGMRKKKTATDGDPPTMGADAPEAADPKDFPNAPPKASGSNPAPIVPSATL